MPHGRNVRSESSVVSSGRLNDTEESSPAADSFARLRAGRNGAEELEDSARGSGTPTWTVARGRSRDSLATIAKRSCVARTIAAASSMVRVRSPASACGFRAMPRTPHVPAIGLSPRIVRGSRTSATIESRMSAVRDEYRAETEIRYRPNAEEHPERSKCALRSPLRSR